LSDATSNGGGGLCWPWNGVGVLAPSATASVTLAEQGRLCEAGASTDNLNAEGSVELESGTGVLAGINGQGTLTFRIEPGNASASSSDASSPDIIPVAIIGGILLVAAFTAIVGGAVCLEMPGPVCPK
jgi:hypothetical protein